jgi:hypothetical protein
MKVTRLCASLCLSVGLAMVSANAQASFVEGKVPFGFTVLGKTFPAGEYRMVAAPHQVRIEDARGKLIAMVLANDVADRSAGKNCCQIIFHCYGDHCFLAEVWFSAQGSGRQLLTSRAEAKWAKAEKGKYFAVLGDRPGGSGPRNTFE